MTKSARTFLTIAIAVLLVAIVGAQKATPAAVLLEAGRQKETLEGDPRGAIAIYKDVVAKYGQTDRAASATALVRMAECYEKIGDPQSSVMYEQILASYADQTAAVTTARQRLSSGVAKLLCDQCADVYGSVGPDGRRMATVEPFFGNGERMGDVGILDLETKTLTPLRIEGSGRAASGIALSPVFSTDMRQIAYTFSNPSKVELRIQARDPGARSRVLVDNPEIKYVEAHAWLENGSVLALLERPDETWEIALVSSATGAITKIKSLGWRVTDQLHSTNPSPDGRFIAYTALPVNPPAPLTRARAQGLDRQIYVLASDGSREVAVTDGAGVKTSPIWTPDGRHLLYVSNTAGKWDLWALPMRDGRPAGAAVLARSNIGDVGILGMSRSGVLHVYEGRAGVNRTAIANVATGNGRPADIADRFIGQRPVWSPDGMMMAVNRARIDGAGIEVVVRTLATGEERVFKREGVANYPFSWFPDSKGLLVLARDGDQEAWYRIDLTTSAFSKLAGDRDNDAFWTHANVRALSADGRTLYQGAYASKDAGTLNRIVGLDLTTGVRRDVVRLPADEASLPKNAQDFALSASPDNRSLALMFFDRKANLAHLATVGVDGQGYREIVPPFRARNLRNKLVWSRDGKWLYFTTKVGSDDDDTHRVMRVSSAGGAPEYTGIEAEGLECFDASPDGNRLSFSTLRPEGTGQLLWALDVSWLMRSAR